MFIGKKSAARGKKNPKKKFCQSLSAGLDKRNSLLHYRINHGSNEECHGAIGI
jgi:hypothetical protein